MNTENGMGIKKMKYRFALLYIVSIVLLAVIFTTLWNIFQSPAPTGFQNELTGITEKAGILKQEKLLQSGMMELQLLDNEFAVSVADSANKQTLDSLNELIRKSETTFGDTIDEIDRHKGDLTDRSDIAKLDSITSIFRIALNNRKSVRSMREILSGENENVSGDKMDLLKLQMELQNKDNKITALENKLNTVQQVPADISKKADNRPEIQTLQADLNTVNEKISTMTALNNSLTKENSNLTARINEFKSSTADFEGLKNTEQSKNELLQSKIDDLNANLILAKVDCNLSRADAKQIISNSKQRKDLLQETLNTLNNLSHSGTGNIQNKVKQKLSQLQRIAATIRD